MLGRHDSFLQGVYLSCTVVLLVRGIENCWKMCRFLLDYWLVIQVLRLAKLPPNSMTSSSSNSQIVLLCHWITLKTLHLTTPHSSKLYILSFIYLLTLSDCPCLQYFAKPLTWCKSSCRTFLCTRRSKVARSFACVLAFLLSLYFLVLFVEYGQLCTQLRFVSYSSFCRRNAALLIYTRHDFAKEPPIA